VVQVDSSAVAPRYTFSGKGNAHAENCSLVA
jgi:hypothetical protein